MTVGTQPGRGPALGLHRDSHKRIRAGETASLMHVGLLTVFSQPGCTLKDVAGGFGTSFEVGRSWPARLLERAKSRVAALPPLTLGYLAAQLTRAGHTVSVHELDARAGQTPSLTPLDRAIVLSSITDVEAERATCARLEARGVPTTVIGAYASARPQRYSDVASAVITGEPEGLGAALLEARGLTSAPSVDDLDALPLPDWSAFDVARFRYAFLGGPVLPVGASRGCAYGCGYCPWRVTAAFRQRDPARVAAEVRGLVDRYGVRSIAFRDPLFNLDRGRVEALSQALRPLGVRFSAEMRADRLDEGLIETLAAAGLRSLEIGVESARTSMLSAHHRKPPPPAQIQRVVRAAQRRGVRVICNFMLGLPEDDERAIRDTVGWAKALDSFAVQFTVATPYPGTTLESQRRLAGAPMNGFAPAFEHPSLTPDRLAQLREWAYVSYHYRPRYALRFLRHAAPAALERAGDRSHKLRGWAARFRYRRPEPAATVAPR